MVPNPRQAESRLRNRTIPVRLGISAPTRIGVFEEETFRNMLMLERRRAERSRKPFVLMLLDAHASKGVALEVASTVLNSIRETDLVGWYKNGVVLGIIFTEINTESHSTITEILRSKIAAALDARIGREARSTVAITVHLFPESQDRNGLKCLPDARFYPELSANGSKKQAPHVIKRAMDIAGSAALLLLLSPVLGMITLAVKLTSKGPAIFRQERLGQFGTKFKLLKFRTMHVDNDCGVHREYIRRYIASATHSNLAAANEPALYKIKDDPRVTGIGKFLRKTSLDELPQFWNVLVGEMSLVGPRPPLSYEFEMYDIWHRRRVLEVRPGVTGLWQVSGRSRLCFDDMVRLDLRYSQSWSLWLDCKILLATPGVVLGGQGAY